MLPMKLHQEIFMNGNQIKLLTKMKCLVKEGKKRFTLRKDIDYLNELNKID